MAIDPGQAVTVVNEVDMETPIGTMPRVALPKECLLGYAYILTIGFGTPCISYKDWSTDAGCYGATKIGDNTLQDHLDRLIWCHSFVTTGGLRNEQVSENGYVYAYERTGDGEDGDSRVHGGGGGVSIDKLSSSDDGNGAGLESGGAGEGSGGAGEGSGGAERRNGGENRGWSNGRPGNNGAMVLLNSDWENEQEITVSTGIPDNTLLVDYVGHGISAVVRDGRITVRVPANREGRGYLILAKPGIQGDFRPGRSSATQEWEGNVDLGIQPAAAEWREVCRIWVDSGQTIQSKMIDYNTVGWRRGTNLELEIARAVEKNDENKDSAGDRPGSRKFDQNQRGDSFLYLTGASPGWYVLRIRGSRLPKVGNWWFRLENTYTAPAEGIE